MLVTNEEFEQVQQNTVYYTRLQWVTVKHVTVEYSKASYSRIQHSMVKCHTLQRSTNKYSYSIYLNKAQYGEVQQITALVPLSTAQCS